MHISDDERQLIEQYSIAQLLANNVTALARLNEHLQATIPVYVEENASSGTVAASTTNTLTLRPDRDTYFKVTGIYVSIPENCTSAQLQLGSQFILPIQNSTTLLTPVQRILTSRDVRQLTFTTGSANGGQAFVWLFGEAIPKYGVL